MPLDLHQGDIVSPSPSANSGNFTSPESDTSVAPSLSLRDFLEILKRRKVIALNTFILVVALGVVLTLMTKPLFRTGARLLVEGRSNTVALSSSNDPLSSVFQPKPGREVDTQIEILRSPLVLDRVYKQASVAKGSVTLDVRRVQQTDVIDLTVTSTSRESAERFASVLPQVYKNDRRADQLREVTASLDFAKRTLEEQNAKLQSTELALETFKNRKGVVNTEGEATDAITIASQNRGDLAKAELEAARMQAQLSALTAERRQLPAFIDQPVTTTNPQILQLNDQIAQLNSERNRLLFLYKPNDDEVRKVDLQIKDLKQRLARTPRDVTNSSRSINPAVASIDAKISDARTALKAAQNIIGPLRQQVAQQKTNLGRFNNIQRVEANLQRDLENSTNAFKTLSDNVLQLSLRKTALEAAAAPVTTMQASGPAVQIAPSMSRNLLTALFLGALLACGAALLQESLDDHLRDEDEVRRLFQISVLGYFPTLASKQPRPILSLEEPDHKLLESFRILRSNVQFALVNSKGQKLLVTSAVPGEGKSYVASNLAIAIAMNGRSVVLVDSDLHRPRQHEIFNVPRYPGLTDLLVGNATLQECVQEVGIPYMRLVTAGVTAPNPAELLGSAAMDDMLQKLGKGVDVVIFDSPPLLATSDSQVMSSKVDGVIYVMQLGKVPRSATQRSFELLRQARAQIIGVVFNQIDEKTSSYYGGYYGGYYSRYSDETEASTENSQRVPLPNGEAVTSWLTKAKRFLHEPEGNNGKDTNHTDDASKHNGNVERNNASMSSNGDEKTDGDKDHNQTS